MAESMSLYMDNTVRPTLINSSYRDSPVSNNSTRRVTNCIYFQSGTCRFGNNCRYPHVLNSRTPENHGLVRQPYQLPSTRNSATELTVFQQDQREPNCNALSKDTDDEPKPKSASTNPPNWADAPVFIPRQLALLSYANMVRLNNEHVSEMVSLCPDFIVGSCPMSDVCPFVHGDMCELCGLAILHPHDEDQRKEHIEACNKEIEQDMEHSFAVQRSIDKSCGICLEIILEKTPTSERRFGILDNCNHVFCLDCIRRWRQQKGGAPGDDATETPFNHTVARTCPFCRVQSDFIIPSLYWVDTQEQKEKLIADYKSALSKKHCKYFKQGGAQCPFGGNCFYLHALPDGTKVELPKPERRRRQNQNGELTVVHDTTIWDFLESRDESHVYFIDSDSGSSDGSEWNN